MSLSIPVCLCTQEVQFGLPVRSIVLVTAVSTLQLRFFCGIHHRTSVSTLCFYFTTDRRLLSLYLEQICVQYGEE